MVPPRSRRPLEPPTKPSQIARHRAKLLDLAPNLNGFCAALRSAPKFKFRLIRARGSFADLPNGTIASVGDFAVLLPDFRGAFPPKRHRKWCLRRGERRSGPQASATSQPVFPKRPARPRPRPEPWGRAPSFDSFPCLLRTFNPPGLPAAPRRGAVWEAPQKPFFSSGRERMGDGRWDGRWGIGRRPCSGMCR
jgi:hypothetical protein